MKKVVAFLGAVVFALLAGSTSIEAQTLPSDGNCWTCVNVSGPDGGDFYTCIGVQTGGYYCSTWEVSTEYNICVVYGSGCTSSLYADTGEFIGQVSCEELSQPARDIWAVAAAPSEMENGSLAAIVASDSWRLNLEWGRSE